MRLYFIRHGESEANLLRQLSNRPGRHPLTPLGRAQAAALAAALPGPLAHIYTSPLLRAAETAALLAAAQPTPITITDALREFDCGAFEGRADPAAWAAHDGLVAAWLAGRPAERLPGGESFDDLRARFVPFVRALTVETPATPPAAGHLALVSHGGVLRLMLPLVLTNISPAFAQAHPLANAAAVVAEPRGAALWCRRWGELDLA